MAIYVLPPPPGLPGDSAALVLLFRLAKGRCGLWVLFCLLVVPGGGGQGRLRGVGSLFPFGWCRGAWCLAAGLALAIGPLVEVRCRFLSVLLAVLVSDLRKRAGERERVAGFPWCLSASLSSSLDTLLPVWVKGLNRPRCGGVSGTVGGAWWRSLGDRESISPTASCVAGFHVGPGFCLPRGITGGTSQKARAVSVTLPNFSWLV